MAMKMYVVLSLLAQMALAMQLNEDVPHHVMSLSVSKVKVTTAAEFGRVFARSEETHKSSMDEISKSLTAPKAMAALENSKSVNSADLQKMTTLLTGKYNDKKLRASHDGFGGLDGARRLLNDMIHEAASKYDAEIAKCTDYYAKQCALMEVARGQISAANFIAATSRMLILDAQGNINTCELRIPESKQELKDHNEQCADELKALDKRLKIVMGDIAIMTMILKMSDCDAKLMQTQKLTMMKCQDRCNPKKSFVTFNHSVLQGQMDQLKSPNAKDLVSSTFADLFAAENDDDDTDISSLIQQDADPKEEKEDPKIKKAKFNNPPVPKTKVPGNPCTDPNMGAPSAEDKRAAKCTLKKSPQCYKLQQRFLQIQAEIEDTRDDLMDQIEKLQEDCKTMKNSLEASIKADNDLLSSSQTKLAAATEKEASAGETGRQVSAENQGYNDDLIKQMKICSTNYINFETELCALKKIRGDLHKKMKPGHSGFFQDCELSKWTPEACTKVCTDPGTPPGEQKIIRSVLQHPSGGAKCLPLSAEKNCNLSPCPINCKLSTWSGWSKCSSKCGGGASTRVRDVKVPMRYDGRPCGGTTQTRQCNVEACEKDCTLHPWTRWTACSKDCDGGTEKRERFIKDPVQGAGSCADEWEKSRLQYKPCNQHRCKAEAGKSLKCNSTLDVIIMMDGTPKSGKKGWAEEVAGATMLVDAFSGPGITAKPNIAVVHYTGPRTWSGVSKCTGKSKKKVDMEGTCRIKIAQQFTEDMKKVKGIINGLEYSPGSKLLSLALMTVQSMFALGRQTARTVVVVFIDGHPLSYRKTQITSHEIRKKARLVYVPVTKFSPLADLKLWSSRRWQENIVSVKDAKGWAKAATSTHIIANICPKKFPKLKSKKV